MLFLSMRHGQANIKVEKSTLFYVRVLSRPNISKVTDRRQYKE